MNEGAKIKYQTFSRCHKVKGVTFNKCRINNKGTHPLIDTLHTIPARFWIFFNNFWSSYQCSSLKTKFCKILKSSRQKHSKLLLYLSGSFLLSRKMSNSLKKLVTNLLIIMINFTIFFRFSFIRDFICIWLCHYREGIDRVKRLQRVKSVRYMLFSMGSLYDIGTVLYNMDGYSVM